MTPQCKHDCTPSSHEVPTLCQMLYCRVSLIYLKFQNHARWILFQLLSIPQKDLPIYYLYLRFQMSELFKQSQFIKYVAKKKSKKVNGEEQIEAAERCQNIIKSGASNTQPRQLSVGKHLIRHIPNQMHIQEKLAKEVPEAVICVPN